MTTYTYDDVIVWEVDTRSYVRGTEGAVMGPFTDLGGAPVSITQDGATGDKVTTGDNGRATFTANAIAITDGTVKLYSNEWGQGAGDATTALNVATAAQAAAAAASADAAQAKTDAAAALAKAGSSAGITNAKAVGCVGDGVADDTAAMQAAFTQAAGGDLFIPPGVYRLTATLLVQAGTRVHAYGATMRRSKVFSFVRNIVATDSTTAGYSGPGRIVFEGGIWDNAGATVHGDMANCFTFAHCEDITVRDLTILDVAGGHGIEWHGVRGGIADNVSIQGFYDTGDRSYSECIQLDTANATGTMGLGDMTVNQDITVRDCYTSASASLPAWGRFVGSHSAYTNDKPHRGVKVLRNNATTATHTVRGYGWSDVVIEENTLQSTSNLAIQVVPAYADGTGGGQANCSGVQILGNTIRDNGYSAIQVAGSGTYSVSKGRIAGNMVINPNGRGIMLGGSPTSDFIIESNQVYTSAQQAFYIDSSTNPTLRNNLARMGTGTAALYANAATTGLRRYGNDFRGYGSGGIADASTGSSTSTADLT